MINKCMNELGLPPRNSPYKDKLIKIMFLENKLFIK